MAEKYVGTGATIAFATSAMALEIVNFNPPPGTLGTVDTSHQATTTAHTKVAVSLIEWGELSMTCHYDPADDPPLGTEETVTITYPGGSTQAFTGITTGWEPNWPFEDKPTVDVNVTVDGDITFSS